MINLNKLRDHAQCGDLILTGTNSTFSLGGLIQFAQRIQTPDGKPSRWKHIAMYIDLYTIAESTMDFKPWKPTARRLDNGPQFNYIETLKDEDYATLLHFTSLTDDQRLTMRDKAATMIYSGVYKYDITGLFGSLLTYWIFRWVKSNPLSKKGQLYCSAFISKILRAIGIDPDEGHTDRNTSPEREWQWAQQYAATPLGWIRMEIIGLEAKGMEKDLTK